MTMTERVVCTIVTKSHLAYARTLAASLSEHHPESTLYVLLADQVDGYFDPALEPFKLIQLEDLPEQETIEKMCFYYTPFELCCALRGFLHEYILHNTDAESWIFLDSDILVCHSLEKIFYHLSSVSILLTPHGRIPVSAQAANPHETNFLRSGISNAGFLGLRRTKETHKFITWFKERLIYYCFNDPVVGDPRGLFVDQLWLNLTFSYFRGVDFLAEPGANLGHWNLWEKKLGTAYDGKITVNQVPLLFVHFSGWDISNPGAVSRYSLLYPEQPVPVWQQLAETYREKLLLNGFETTSEYPYAFDYFENGDRIDPTMRRAYYNEVMGGIAPETSPFKRADYFQANPYVPKTVSALTATLEHLQQQYDDLLQHARNIQAAWQTTETALENTHAALQEAQANFERSQQQLTATQEQIAATQRRLEQSQTQLEQSQTQLQKTQAELEHTQQELHRIHGEVHHLKLHIAAMESTKFWKLRTIWVRLKQRWFNRL